MKTDHHAASSDHIRGQAALAGGKAGLLLAALRRGQRLRAATVPPMRLPRRKRRLPAEHFCQLRPGVKHVLQWRAYLAGLLLLAGASGSASAQDDALYGPSAPPGSAFVRVFNPTPQDDLEARIGDRVMPGIDAYRASDFVFLPAGRYTLTAGGASESVTLKGGRYYTAVPVGKDFTLFDNDGAVNRLKARVIVFNLTDAPVTLQTPQGAAVVEKVPPEKSGERSVNPVKTSLQLAGAGTQAEVKPIKFERGRAFSLFVLPAGDQPMPVWAVN